MTEELVDFGDISCYTKSKGEAEFIHREIFTEHCYDVQDLPASPFIVDIGANIGLFSLYMKQKHPSCKILAFEPAPETFATLNRNLALHDLSDVESFRFGLASKASTAELTYFPNIPGNSTLYPEQKHELYKLAIKLRPNEADRRYDTGQKLNVDLQRLSYFLDRHPDLQSIDLLKIDVEGAEYDVLLGLDEVHWHLVRNIILETCETSGVVTAIEALLRSKGFSVTREGVPFSPAEFYTISASRCTETAST